VRLLLDTHIWIWMVLGSDDLPEGIRQLLEDPDHEMFLSPISVWEALILAEKGRLALGQDPVLWVQKALEGSPVREASLNWDVAFRSRRISLPHEDPADRFIAATALVFDLCLVSMDKRLRKIPKLRTISK
jgi:PIN domain nuclease of toxin-antitoxin system